MRRVRFFVLWIVMFAVPFQAFAATAMAFCGPGHGSALVAASAGAAIAEPAVHVDGHADHRHAHAHATAAHDAKKPAPGSADTASSAHAQPDTMHKCSACAACHAAALISTPELAVVQGLPGADLAAPPNAMATVVPRLLDKPPRA